jgi:hypothetical protein
MSSGAAIVHVHAEDLAQTLRDVAAERHIAPTATRHPPLVCGL